MLRGESAILGACHDVGGRLYGPGLASGAVSQILSDDWSANGQTSNNIRWALSDIRGSVRELVSGASTSGVANNAEVAAFHYDSFGQLTAGSGSPAGTHGPSAPSPAAVDFLFGYAGGLYDGETAAYNSGQALYHMGAREYSPVLGQFLSQDPIHADVVNPYRYAGNDPVNGTDPSGLFTRSVNASLIGSVFGGSGALSGLLAAEEEAEEEAAAAASLRSASYGRANYGGMTYSGASGNPALTFSGTTLDYGSRYAALNAPLSPLQLVQQNLSMPIAMPYNPLGSAGSLVGAPGQIEAVGGAPLATSYVGYFGGPTTQTLAGAIQGGSASLGTALENWGVSTGYTGVAATTGVINAGLRVVGNFASIVDVPSTIGAAVGDIEESVAYGKQYGVIAGVGRQVGGIAAYEAVKGIDYETGLRLTGDERLLALGEFGGRLSATASTAAGLINVGTAFKATPNPMRTNFSAYEVLSEQPISGASRSAQRASANNALHVGLAADPELAARFNQLLGKDVLTHMESGAGRALLYPPGTEWHHPANNPNVLQLLRTSEHTNPALQPILHPGGIGGYGNFYGTE